MDAAPPARKLVVNIRRQRSDEALKPRRDRLRCKGGIEQFRSPLQETLTEVRILEEFADQQRVLARRRRMIFLKELLHKIKGDDVALESQISRQVQPEAVIIRVQLLSSGGSPRAHSSKAVSR